MSDSETLTFQQADRLYQTFPDFSAWLLPADDELLVWDRFVSHLEELRTKASPDALRKSVEIAVRAAAIDTGAIEGLYTVDRGFTMTVATQALAWEHALEEKGEKVRELFEAQLEAYELVTRRLEGEGRSAMERPESETGSLGKNGSWRPIRRRRA